MKIYFFLLLFSTQAFALECHDSETPLIMFRDEIVNILPAKKCPSDDELIIKQVKDEYEKFYEKEPQVKKSVKGYQLEGSAKELQLANKMLGAKPPKGWKAAASGCKTIQCAFEKLLNSKEAAMQLFNIHAKSDYALSLDQTINQNLADQIWSAKEIREIDAAISKLPSELTNLPHLNIIERMADGYRRAYSSFNAAAFASPRMKNYKEAELVLYDSGLTRSSTKNPYRSKSWTQEVLVHEICHHYDFKGYYATNEKTMTTEQKSSEFSKLSGWKKTTGPKGEDVWKASPTAQFVSSYAGTEPAEDFAETCANYILDPKKLKTKAPSKYAFMKDKIFNKKEYTDTAWARDGKSWAPLAALIRDEKECTSKLSKCIENITYSNGNFCQSQETKASETLTWSSITCGELKSLVRNNACSSDYMNTRINELDDILQSNENYCEMNGPELIRNSKDSICANSIQGIVSQLEKVFKYDLASDVSKCEQKKDYTKECIQKEVIKKLQIDPELQVSIEKSISAKIPNRMVSLSNKLSGMNTSEWLKPCLSVVSGITKYSNNNYQYYSSSEEYRGGFLAEFLYPGHNDKDINKACSQEMLKTLHSEGYKTSSAENTTTLINGAIIAEIRSYEKNVLGKIEVATSGCLLSKCKVKKISELLLAWENENPEKRKGFATEEHAKELRKKFNFY